MRNTLSDFLCHFALLVLAQHFTFKSIEYLGESRLVCAFTHLMARILRCLVVNHAPIPGVGTRLLKHYDLYLIRHDLPGNVSPHSPVTPPSTSYLSSLTTKSRGPSLRYRIILPTKPVGPLDIVSLQVTVQPLDPLVSVRSATAVVERKIQFSEFPTSPSGTSTPSAPTLSSYSYLPSNPDLNSHDHQSVAANSCDITSATSSSNDLHYLSSTSSSISDTRPLLPQQPSSVPSTSSVTHTSERTTTHIFAHLESSHRFTRDSTGTWRQTLTFSWPDTSPSSRWTVGETLQTGMASIRFFIRLKVYCIFSLVVCLTMYFS
jgi:hypothetical protein